MQPFQIDLCPSFAIPFEVLRTGAFGRETQFLGHFEKILLQGTPTGFVRTDLKILC